MDLTASVLPRLQLKLERVWADALANENSQRYDPEMNLLEAVRAIDTARIGQYFFNGNRCASADLFWLTKSTNVATSGSIDEGDSPRGVKCDFTGDAPSSKKDTISLTNFSDYSFMIPAEICDNLYNYPDLLQFEEAMAEKALAEKTNDYVATQLKLAAGNNKMPAVPGDIGAVDNGVAKTTEIQEGNWNWSDFVPYVLEMGVYNRMMRPYIVDGINLFADNVRAMIAQGKFGDTGGSKAYDMLSRYFAAPLTFNKNGMNDTTFVIDQGAVTMQYWNSFPNYAVPNSYLNELYYSKPSRFLRQSNGQPVTIDVQYKYVKKERGDGTGLCDFFHHFTYRIWYKFKVNPNLGDGYTGVIRLQRVDDGVQVGQPAPKPSYVA